jgi:hypothetical protein
MIVRTRNTTYVLEDCGDGAFMINGSPRFCPVPLLVTLYEPPQVGRAMLFEAVDKEAWAAKGFRSHVITSTVQEITP